MNNRVIAAIPGIVLELQQKNVSDINAFLGFDASIDNIVRVAKNKNEFYADSRQFGEFLISHEKTSCGIELRTQQSKIGGNMVITGNALGNLGMKVTCVGTFGLPEILPVFHSMSGNCMLYTVGEPITATALEFNDTKAIMFDPDPYDKLTWDVIKNHLGTDRIKELISGKQLVSFLNWSEIENSSLIWKGILDEILPSAIPSKEHPWFLSDFSDCTRRSKKEILFAIALLNEFRKYFKILISLNQNEADLILGALDLPPNDPDEHIIEKLFTECHADVLVIHRTQDAIAFDGVTFQKCDTFYCENPTLLTGGGDNFNAGLCLSRFFNFNLFQSLVFANSVSGYYVKTGTSPDIASLIEFLKQHNLTQV